MMLLNGLGARLSATDALPPLQDERVEIVARTLAKQRRYDPDHKEPGGVCLHNEIADTNWWYIGRLPNGDPYVYQWMRHIEEAVEILKGIDGQTMLET